MSAPDSKHGALISLPSSFSDERGTIQNLVDTELGSALVIHSNPGAIRGNHYHKTDFHYCWLESGEMIYAHRPVGSTGEPEHWVIQPGQMFYSPPMHEHVMHFTKQSVLFVVARNNRKSPQYEEDTIRIAPLEIRANK